MADTTPLNNQDEQAQINTARISSQDTRDTTQELSKVSLISAANAHFNVGMSTDVGMIRTNNQDAAYTFVSLSRTADAQPEFAMLVLADGMGGHMDGELASAVAVRTVVNKLLTSVYLPFMNLDEISDRTPISEALEVAIQAAHNAVISGVPDGGTTLTAAVLLGNLAHIGHVGDSRAYLITPEKIERISQDHSLVQRLIEMDEIRPDQAEYHPQKSVLYRALGQSDQLEVDIYTRRLLPGSALLLCSDGLWGMVRDDDLKELSTSMASQDACDRMVALANQNGGQDNISVILARIPG